MEESCPRRASAPGVCPLR